MSGLDTRLRLIERHVPPVLPPEPAVDYDRLSVPELEELEALVLKLGEEPNGRVDFRELSDDELDRLAKVIAKATVNDAA